MLTTWHGYDPDDSDADVELEIKGGKPSKGTSADKRLKDNKPGKSGSDDDKSPFPGAATPFKPKPKKGDK